MRVHLLPCCRCSFSSKSHAWYIYERQWFVGIGSFVESEISNKKCLDMWLYYRCDMDWIWRFTFIYSIENNLPDLANSVIEISNLSNILFFFSRSLFSLPSSVAWLPPSPLLALLTSHIWAEHTSYFDRVDKNIACITFIWIQTMAMVLMSFHIAQLNTTLALSKWSNQRER